MVTKRAGYSMAVILLIGLMLVSGCQFDPGSISKPIRTEEDQLIRVEIVFTDNQTLIGYVKDLSITPDAKIYVGGSSTNYLYDAQGNIVGSYNYQRVLYMKILPPEEAER
ncbi:MAG TPA: hypothetical protein PLG09_06875 [Syntrophomonadaceae bacterium]|nr:hypothetical protein [Syntrophomonadaceae bacterium]HOQ09831.1 hypothetical protein [Syntrophomonadaceae bacterium]HPU48851.1 hypothetical protein [Syntrophomonadaceae bacterium]